MHAAWLKVFHTSTLPNVVTAFSCQPARMSLRGHYKPQMLQMDASQLRNLVKKTWSEAKPGTLDFQKVLTAPIDEVVEAYEEVAMRLGVDLDQPIAR